MISRKYFNTFPALNLPSYITNVPWPNLVLDNFIEEDALDLIVYQVLSRNHEYEIDYRGKEGVSPLIRRICNKFVLLNFSLQPKASLRIDIISAE